jgi:hypothetical protein
MQSNNYTQYFFNYKYIYIYIGLIAMDERRLHNKARRFDIQNQPRNCPQIDRSMEPIDSNASNQSTIRNYSSTAIPIAFAYKHTIIRLSRPSNTFLIQLLFVTKSSLFKTLDHHHRIIRIFIIVLLILDFPAMSPSLLVLLN